MATSTYYIYAMPYLRGTKHCTYIGQTGRDPAIRQAEHLLETRYNWTGEDIRVVETLVFNTDDDHFILTHVVAAERRWKSKSAQEKRDAYLRARAGQ